MLPDEVIESRNYDITLLEAYSNFLMENGYLDTDWCAEEPYAIDEFLKSRRKENP
jgi:hypothetical protein